jgi:hypothetical protein
MDKIEPAVDPVLVQWVLSEAALGRFSQRVPLPEAMRRGYFVSKLFAHQPRPEMKPRPCHHLKKVNEASGEHAAAAEMVYQRKENLWERVSDMGSAVASVWDAKSAFRFLSLRPDQCRFFGVATMEPDENGVMRVYVRLDKCCGFGHARSPFNSAALQELISLAE